MTTDKTPIKDEQGDLVKSKWSPIRNGRGEATGWIELLWSPRLNQWVSIPGVTRFRNAA